MKQVYPATGGSSSKARSARSNSASVNSTQFARWSVDARQKKHPHTVHTTFAWCAMHW